MKLYGFPPSPNTWKVRAVAAHLGIPLELEFVDLTKGGSRTPAFLAINPAGRTPALVDGDFKLGESTAIMQYLASQKPNSLWPNDARTRADIMRWQSWSLAHWSKEGCEPLIFNRLVKKTSEPRRPGRSGGGPGHRVLQQGGGGARCASGKAAVSRRQGTDARGLFGRSAAVLCQRGRVADRALCTGAGMVRPSLRAAVLARDRTAVRRRGGVIERHCKRKGRLRPPFSLTVRFEALE